MFREKQREKQRQEKEERMRKALLVPKRDNQVRVCSVRTLCVY